MRAGEISLLFLSKKAKVDLENESVLFHPIDALKAAYSLLAFLIYLLFHNMD